LVEEELWLAVSELSSDLKVKGVYRDIHFAGTSIEKEWPFSHMGMGLVLSVEEMSFIACFKAR
jgi:hypothetical protein